ncbi:hypothetical protein GCK32_011043 [Trichostrongylus colubriformis]|uniref:Uncharacterized protein n=1 Tax=Trichostrongylus colubriformis TaxID=6319 RepID=A0AAN8IYW5_TRICO
MLFYVLIAFIALNVFTLGEVMAQSCQDLNPSLCSNTYKKYCNDDVLADSVRELFVRRSMTEDERKREYELRKEAEERNKGKDVREWVVYQGQLKHTSELPHKRSVNP